MTSRSTALAGLFLALGLLTTAVPAMGADGEGKSVKLCYTSWGKHGGENLPGKGMIPDIATRVFERAGYGVTVDIVPWPRCVNKAKRRDYDLIASAWRGANFDPHFDYLNITLRNDISFIVRADSELKSGKLSELTGKIVGHVRDSGGMDEIRGNPAIKTREVAVMDKMITMLMGGRIDAIISDPPSLFTAARKMEPPVDGRMRILSPPLTTNYNSPLIAKDHPRKNQIAQDFDRAFRALVAEGMYRDLIGVHGEEFRFEVPEGTLD